jgi:hypothetical protein
MRFNFDVRHYLSMAKEKNLKTRVNISSFTFGMTPETYCSGGIASYDRVWFIRFFSNNGPG